MRTLGRMRGRPCTEPFLVEAEKGGSRLSPQQTFSSAPLGNPVAPSSVTFGDSFPPRGSLWVVRPYTKKRPKSGHADGHRNSPTTGTMRHPTPKRASGNERAIKKGVQGARPPALFPPAFSGESRAPARSRAGNHVAGLDLRWSQPSPPARGSPVLRTLRVGRALTGLGAQRPGGPACPAGVPISPEKWGERGPGLRPWTPGFIVRLLSLAGFGDRCL